MSVSPRLPLWRGDFSLVCFFLPPALKQISPVVLDGSRLVGMLFAFTHMKLASTGVTLSSLHKQKHSSVLFFPLAPPELLVGGTLCEHKLLLSDGWGSQLDLQLFILTHLQAKIFYCIFSLFFFFLLKLNVIYMLSFKTKQILKKQTLVQWFYSNKRSSSNIF